MAIEIFDFPGGARGLRAAWLCEEIGIPYEFRAVGFPPSAEYREINPIGRVPYLLDGEVGLGESIAIMLYLAKRFGPTSLLPDEGVALARTLEFTVYGEAALTSQMDVLLAVKYGGAPGGTGGWSEGVARNQLDRSLRHLAASLAKGPMIVGESFTLADISIATALTIFTRALELELPSDLQSYLDRIRSRAAYVRASERWR